jgi:formate dehydrogenase maturation protein FdhE
MNTCAQCHSYVKVFATVTPLSHAEVLKRDLETYLLDVAAVDQGFVQASQPGFPLEVDVIDNSETGPSR